MKKLLNIIIEKLSPQKTPAPKTFFDYNSREKKKIIKAATVNANKMQLELVKRYEAAYHSN